MSPICAVASESSDVVHIDGLVAAAAGSLELAGTLAASWTLCFVNQQMQTKGRDSQPGVSPYEISSILECPPMHATDSPIGALSNTEH